MKMLSAAFPIQKRERMAGGILRKRERGEPSWPSWGAGRRRLGGSGAAVCGGGVWSCGGGSGGVFAGLVSVTPDTSTNSPTQP